jgi:hypothetical protein
LSLQLQAEHSLINCQAREEREKRERRGREGNTENTEIKSNGKRNGKIIEHHSFSEVSRCSSTKQ